MERAGDLLVQRPWCSITSCSWRLRWATLKRTVHTYTHISKNVYPRNILTIKCIYFYSMEMSLPGQRLRMSGPHWQTVGQRISKSSCTSSSVCQELAATQAFCPMWVPALLPGLSFQYQVQCVPIMWLTVPCPVSVCVWSQVKRVVVYLGRDKTMQLLEELMCELDLTDPVSSAVTHMDNPPYYRITSSYKIPSVTSGKWPLKIKLIRDKDMWLLL